MLGVWGAENIMKPQQIRDVKKKHVELLEFGIPRFSSSWDFHHQTNIKRM
jgi:hypothetical protein